MTSYMPSNSEAQWPNLEIHTLLYTAIWRVRIHKEKERIQEERCRKKIHFVSLAQAS